MPPQEAAPSQATADAAASWYMGRDDQRYGPYTLDEIRGFAAEGRLAPDDLVWHSSLPDWVTLAEARALVPDLR